MYCISFPPSLSDNNKHYTVLYHNMIKRVNYDYIGQKKIYVFTVTCQKNLGSVGQDFFFLLSTKPEIVVPVSGIRFRYLIFENSGKMTNYAVFLPSLLSISTKS